MRLTLAAAAVAASVTASIADPASSVVESSERAIARGYGSMCSLEMKPVRTGGYYPCLDFGPYRYVRGYGKVYVFVVEKGRAPFLVLSGSSESAAFLYEGPWQEDMPARIALWWNGAAEGGAETMRQEAARSADLKAASDYIKKIRGDADEEAKPEPQVATEQTAHPAVEDISPDIRDLLTSQ